SQTMNSKAHQSAFDPNKTYVGLFDGTDCYKVGANLVFVPDPDATQTKPCTAAYPWDGNLLNWATMRRIDIVKWALVGGKCSSSRKSTPPFHECAGAYLEGQGQQQSMYGSNLNFTQSISNANAQGRVPTPPLGTVYFHVIGTNSSLYGKFCLSGQLGKPANASSCTAGGGTVHEIRVQPPANPAD
ncbi:hypothetical protein MYX04_14620, partial [Nitrospiraceae bacterium AH_259_D15_M11_P09]|nr:hypothetical protein [Nitrospiraceae bacterium AH_259_D15_M11_P09]